MGASFIDTNVLVYLATANGIKADQAEQLVRSGGIISVQVLNEFANVARRRMQLSWNETRTLLDLIRKLLTVVPLDLETHQHGINIAERYQLSIYDGLIVAAALRAECTTLWTEDLQHGLRIENRLQVLNPFAGPAAAP